MKGERHAFQILRELGPECDRLGVRVVDARGGRTSASDFLDKIVLRIECLEQQLQEADGKCEKLSRRLRLADAALRGTGQGWIPVGERLPEDRQQCFVARWDSFGIAWWHDDFRLFVHDDIGNHWTPTHWMPLPAPPEVMP